MSTIATLWVKLGLDSKGFNEGVEGASKKMQNVGGSMMKVGAGMTAGLTLPIMGAGVAMAKGAATLEDSMNAVNVVFGDSAKVIEDYGKTAAETAGVSTSEFNQMSTVTGAFLKNMGFDLAGAAEETISLTERAADMASVMGGPVSGALEAIQSGLKGEFNPLEQFGVKMNAAMIEAKALSMGLVGTTADMTKINGATLKVEQAMAKTAKATEEFGSDSIEARLAVQKQAEAQEALETAMQGSTDGITDNMKAQAALALIYEQTDVFAGDFENTAGDTANAVKILTAQVKTQADALGLELLPYVLQLVSGISGLVEKFQALSPEQKKMGLIIAGVLAVIGPLITFIGGLISAFGTVISIVGAVAGALTFPLIAILAAVIAVVALLAAAWANDWGGIREKTKVIVDWIKDKIQKFLVAIKAWWDEHGESVIQAATKMWDIIKGKIDTTVEFIKGTVETFLRGLQIFWDRHGQDIMNTVTILWMQIKIIIDKGLVVIKALFGVFKAAFEGDWYMFGVKLREVWDALWDLIKTAAILAWANIKQFFSTAIEDIITWFKETDWLQVGKDIICGIGNGLLGASGWLRDTAISVAQGVTDAFEGFFGIDSPSTLMENLIGKNLALGLIVGLEDNLTPQALQPAMSGVSASVSGIGAVGEAQSGGITMPAVTVNINGNANEDDVRRGVNLGIASALRSAGIA